MKNLTLYSLLLQALFFSCLIAEEQDNADFPIVNILTKELDFGDLPLGEERVMEIEVRNYGYISYKDAVIYGFSIVPDDKEFYMLDSATHIKPISISPHNTKSFRVKFRPNSIRDYSSVIYIKSNALGVEPIYLIGRSIDSLQSSVQDITEIESLSFKSIDEGSDITFSIVSDRSLENGTFSIYSQEGKLINTINVSSNSTELSVIISKSELPRLSLIRFTQGERVYTHKFARE
jgi:hypothetical protein